MGQISGRKYSLSGCANLDGAEINEGDVIECRQAFARHDFSLHLLFSDCLSFDAEWIDARSASSAINSLHNQSVFSSRKIHAKAAECLIRAAVQLASEKKEKPSVDNLC